MTDYVDFAAFHGLSWTSKAIRFYTRSTLSHIAVCTSGNSLIEAWPHTGGPKQWWDFSNFKRHTPGTPFDIWRLKMDRSDAQYCMLYYKHLAGVKRPYNWRGIFGFVFKSRKNNNAGDFCSEGAIRPVAENLGLTETNPSHVSPSDFVGLIQALGAVQIRSGVVR